MCIVCVDVLLSESVNVASHGCADPVPCWVSVPEIVFITVVTDPTWSHKPMFQVSPAFAVTVPVIVIFWPAYFTIVFGSVSIIAWGNAFTLNVVVPLKVVPLLPFNTSNVDDTVPILISCIVCVVVVVVIGNEVVHVMVPPVVPPGVPVLEIVPTTLVTPPTLS